MNSIVIERLPYLKAEKVNLSASKSESNRALIIQALADSNIHLHNLSDARDTRLMESLLKSDTYELNAKDAGTTMRFLTAYCASQNRPATLTGTPRMQERPIRILVNALRELGAEITYLKNEGFPPLKILGMEKQSTDFIKIRGDVSSQYISALLMIAPTLEKGLTLHLKGKIGSWPYITMTLGLMEHFGVKAKVNESEIHVSTQSYQSNDYTIESDWSGASYWYSFMALSQPGKLALPGLRSPSYQGDQTIAEMMEHLGVKTLFEPGQVLISGSDHKSTATLDFTHCPDLAQTVAVAAAAKGVEIQMTGLESLRIKETDRIAALQNELRKIGADLIEEGSSWYLQPSENLPETVVIETYEDHRMAMAFAPLATQMQVEIKDPQVVQKSYPGFWQEMESAGFNIRQK